jgi:hypothetical protein
MNCQTARQTLELLRPLENATSISGEAEQHVRECLDCQDAVRAQQQLDLRIGRVCRDLPVPSDLKDRLLVELAATCAQEPGVARPTEIAGQPAPSARPVPARRRRWLVRSLVAACVVAIAGIGTWLLRPPAATIILDDVTKQAIEAGPAQSGVADFLAFRNGQQVQPPDTMITADLKGAPQQLGDRDVAVYFFTIRDGSRTFEARLIVIPRASVVDPPTATSFQPGQFRYRGAYCATAWVEGEFVYVCCVKGGEGLLHKLQHRAV